MKLCLVMPPPPIKTSGTGVFIAAIDFIGCVAVVVGHHVAVVGHHVAVPHGGVHHVPAVVLHHVAVHHVDIHHVVGHYVAPLVGHVVVPVCWRPGCLLVTITGQLTDVGCVW